MHVLQHAGPACSSNASPRKSQQRKKESKMHRVSPYVSWLNNGDDTLAVYCYVHVLKEQGSSSDGVEDWHVAACNACRMPVGEKEEQRQLHNVGGVNKKKQGKKA